MSNVNLTKIGIDLESVFPRVKDISPVKLLGEGWSSVVVEGKNSTVFRVAKNRVCQSLHAKQVKVLPLISKKLDKIQIPIPVCYIETSDEFPFGVMGYRKIAGSIFDPKQISDKVLEKLSFQIAEMLINFHHIKISDSLLNAGLPVNEYSPEAFQQKWYKVSEWLSSKLTSREFDEVSTWWNNLIVFFEYNPQKKVLVHGDPWYENIILDKNLNLKGIVDFDKISVGDHGIDFFVQQKISREFMDTVVRNYQNLGGNIGDNFELRIKYFKGLKAIDDLIYCLDADYIYSYVLERIMDSIFDE